MIPPFGLIKTRLTFQELLALGGGTLRCGWCGHQFALTNTTSDHDCKSPTFHVSEVQPEPMKAPMGLAFYMDTKYDPPKEPR